MGTAAKQGNDSFLRPSSPHPGKPRPATGSHAGRLLYQRCTAGFRARRSQVLARDRPELAVGTDLEARRRTAAGTLSQDKVSTTGPGFKPNSEGDTCCNRVDRMKQPVFNTIPTAAKASRWSALFALVAHVHFFGQRWQTQNRQNCVAGPAVPIRIPISTRNLSTGEIPPNA